MKAGSLLIVVEVKTLIGFCYILLKYNDLYYEDLMEQLHTGDSVSCGRYWKVGPQCRVLSRGSISFWTIGVTLQNLLRHLVLPKSMSFPIISFHVSRWNHATYICYAWLLPTILDRNVTSS
jgi:hypothetical protein